MSAFRVSFNGSFRQSLLHIQDVGRRYQKALNVAGSLRQVSSPADGPAAYQRILKGRTDFTRLGDYIGSLRSVGTELAVADASLSSVGSVLARLREIAVAGASETNGAEARSALNEEVLTLKSELLTLANTRYQNRYIFAGHQYDSSAYDADGTYQGDSGVRSYLAGPSYHIDVGIPGDQIFGTASGGADLFSTADALAQALASNDAEAVAATLEDLDAGQVQVNRARSILGARLNHATNLQSGYEQQQISVVAGISNDEDADAAAAFSNLAQLSTALEATLQVSASVSKLSLLSYL